MTLERHMAKFAGMALALILANISAADADPNSGCLMHKALCSVPLAAQEVSATDRWKVAVLCCCKTYSGGECCIQAAQCGGKPPGCFCAAPSAPATPPANANTASTTVTTSTH